MSKTFLDLGIIKQEVHKMVKNLFYIGLLLLLFFLMFMMMLSAGWIKIIVDAGEIKNDIKNVGSEIMSNEEIQQLPPTNIRENRLFRVEYHTVKPGESLFHLEKQYGTSWKVIQKTNKIENPHLLKTGIILRVPVRIIDS